jgi:hypothetical protein
MAGTMQLKLSVGNKTLSVKHYVQGHINVSRLTTHHRENFKCSQISFRLLTASCDDSKCDAPLVRNLKDLALRSAVLADLVIFHSFCPKYSHMSLKADRYRLLPNSFMFITVVQFEALEVTQHESRNESYLVMLLAVKNFQRKL